MHTECYTMSSGKPIEQYERPNRGNITPEPGLSVLEAVIPLTVLPRMAAGLRVQLETYFVSVRYPWTPFFGKSADVIASHVVIPLPCTLNVVLGRCRRWSQTRSSV